MLSKCAAIVKNAHKSAKLKLERSSAVEFDCKCFTLQFRKPHLVFLVSGYCVPPAQEDVLCEFPPLLNWRGNFWLILDTRFGSSK